MTPALGGLQHVSLETRRDAVEAEVAFWALLGFSVVEPPSSLRDRATWVQAPDGVSQIHLLHAPDPVAPPRGHVAIVAPALEETAAALRDAGFAVEPRTPHWGAARAYVRSPGGHRVELMAFAPTDARAGG
ncbi:MAG TPA: VOC family protein [Baekduia sp.]|uniref:VOC family protein n=1 Tax=Baekduia sp. TaxID=2600305 RepID=UPI002D783070|nr:VOC family protein [Baekduia sp.]HET6509417.1 VOC family protein [Baekduia sp.]